MAQSQHEFLDRLSSRAGEVTRVLESLLSPTPQPGETSRPERLLAAMQHGVLNGGKRLRPFLLVETAQMLGATGIGPIRAGAALECVHCYSLIHDDLPAMDDDDLRRGQPTVHKAFDEATAILAGDALLTLAFDILADEATHVDPQIRSALVVSLARSAGIGGMAGGQMLDIGGSAANPGIDEILLMQSMKTGALIRHACEAGAIIAGADVQTRSRLMTFGELIGKAFQLADDILDETSSTLAMGKETAKDREQGKATLVSMLGLPEAREKAASLLEEAVELLEPFGDRARMLSEAARFTVERSH
ncbi:MAG: polyprenyl synthetase family protein [Nitratireductor sp.]